MFSCNIFCRQGSWGDQHTNLSAYIGYNLIKINETPISKPDDILKAKKAYNGVDDVTFYLQLQAVHKQYKQLRNFRLPLQSNFFVCLPKLMRAYLIKQLLK